MPPDKPSVLCKRLNFLLALKFQEPQNISICTYTLGSGEISCRAEADANSIALSLWALAMNPQVVWGQKIEKPPQVWWVLASSRVLHSPVNVSAHKVCPLSPQPVQVLVWCSGEARFGSCKTSKVRTTLRPQRPVLSRAGIQGYPRACSAQLDL